MGNTNCCASRKEQFYYGFKDHELKDLKLLFRTLVSSQSETKKGDEFNCKALSEVFPENPDFAVKLYKFMKHHTAEPDDQGRGIDVDTFLSVLELLTSDRSELTLKKYRNLEKHFLLAAIFLERPEMTEEGAYKGLKLSYSSSLEFVKCMLRLFQCEKDSIHTIDDNVARVLIDAVFDVNPGGMDWRTLLFFIRQNLIFVPTAILYYFRIKFMRKPYKLRLPELIQSSNLLSNDMLALFALSNLHLQESSRLSLLYSTTIEGFSFQKVITALQYAGPTLILARHQEGYDRPNGSYVFGGFANKPWVDDAEYSDDDRSYLFSVYPKFRNFFHRTRTSEDINTNFTFFNTDRARNPNVGIGFGGQKGKNFRLWLDADMKEKSYSKVEDGTYEKGALVPAYVKRLNIDFIEIWGLQSASRMIDTDTPTEQAGTAITEHKTVTTTTPDGPTVRASSTLRNSRPERGKFTVTKASFQRSDDLLANSLKSLENDRASVTSFRKTTQPQRSANSKSFANYDGGKSILSGTSIGNVTSDNGREYARPDSNDVRASEGRVVQRQAQNPPMFNSDNNRSQRSTYTIKTNYGESQQQPSFDTWKREREDRNSAMNGQ